VTAFLIIAAAIVALVIVMLTMRLIAINRASGGATYSRRQWILPAILAVIFVVLGRLIQDRI
jgi:uncharacterized integral membrane protein